jgi:repressor LexA
MPEQYTEKQGQYLAFIDSYMTMYGRAPAETDLRRFFRTTPPTIHQMILKLEEKGFISRVPRQARSIKLLIDPDELPRLKRIRPTDCRSFGGAGATVCPRDSAGDGQVFSQRDETVLACEFGQFVIGRIGGHFAGDGDRVEDFVAQLDFGLGIVAGCLDCGEQQPELFLSGLAVHAGPRSLVSERARRSGAPAREVNVVQR